VQDEEGLRTIKYHKFGHAETTFAATFTADDSEKLTIVCFNWESTSSAIDSCVRRADMGLQQLRRGASLPSPGYKGPRLGSWSAKGVGTTCVLIPPKED